MGQEGDNTGSPETEVEIAQLLPYEAAAVFGRVQQILHAIDRGEDRTMTPISIFTFEGCTMVRDGTNRVVAYRLRHGTHIRARHVDPPMGADLLRFTIGLREEDEMQGFAHFPIDQTDDDRVWRTGREMRQFCNH